MGDDVLRELPSSTWLSASFPAPPRPHRRSLLLRLRQVRRQLSSRGLIVVPLTVLRGSPKECQPWLCRRPMHDVLVCVSGSRERRERPELRRAVVV